MMMTRDCTHGRVRTFNVGRFTFWFLFVFILSAPVWSFLLTYHYVAPQLVGSEMAELASANMRAQEDLIVLTGKNNKLQDELRKAQDAAQKDRQLRAEAEARAAILENSRSNTSTRLQTLEDENLDLRRSVNFYEKLFKPAAKEQVQCFNISAEYSKRAKTVDYHVNFLRLEQNRKDKLVADVKYRILTGRSALAMDDASIKANHSQSLGMVKDIVLKGKIQAELPEEGLRILDIKAYDKDDNVIGHCWKSF